MVKRRSEAGQTMPIVALALVTLLASAGLAVDMGFMRYEKRVMQNAADAAALAGATDENLGDTSMYVTDAQSVAGANGFQNGVNNTTVTVINPVPGVNFGTAVRVRIQKIYPSYFMQVVGIAHSTITAVGTATVSTSPGCMYALDQAGTGITLNAGVSAPNCGIVDNGPLSGSGDITAASVGVFGSSGGYGGVSSPNGFHTIVQPASDPMQVLVAPTPAGTCIHDPNVRATSGPLKNGVVTLDPGTYCGITIDSGGKVTFDPGLYILDTGIGLRINGTGTATNNSDGVTFYITSAGGSLKFSGTGSISLSASASPVDPLPSGILFFQDPANTAAADVSEGASGNVKLAGTLYFPVAPLTIAGSITGTNAVTVAGSITVTGSTLLTADSPSVPGGSPLQSVSLVE